MSSEEWLREYAAALATVVRPHHLRSLAAEVLAEDGITVEHLKAAGVEDVDLRELAGP